MTTQRLNIAAVIAASVAFFAASPSFAQEADAAQLATASVSQVASGASRAQIQAEAIEARRLGLSDGGEGPTVEATPAQRESIRLAGLRAVQALTATAAR